MTDERRPSNRKFRLIMGALAVVAVVSGGAAYAASRDNSPQARSQAIVNDAAGTLGVDPTKLSDALKKALENQVDAQVTAGTLTKEQADAIKKRIEDGTQPIFGGPGFGGGPRGHFGRFGHAGPGFGFGFGFRGPALMAGIDDVATYLGLKPADLVAQLRSGKSLADIATAQGKTVDGLKTAITDATTKQLDAAVTAGKLTKDQETKLLAGLASRLDDLVNGAHPLGGFGRFGHGGPGFGFGFGFGGPGLTAGIVDVATYLGLKPADLATQLRSGKSLADIATAQGKTVDGLKTAITDAMTKQFDAAVTAGKLTKDQETKLLADLASRLDNIVNDVHEPGGFGRFGHGHDGWKGDDDGNGSAPQDGSPPPAAPADLTPAPATA
jgi:lambda repressor-like predicted transcriptional regulator